MLYQVPISMGEGMGYVSNVTPAAAHIFFYHVRMFLYDWQNNGLLYVTFSYIYLCDVDCEFSALYGNSNLFLNLKYHMLFSF